MPFLNKQLEILNDILRDQVFNGEKYSQARMEGLAKTTIRTGENGEQRFPYVMNEHGDPVDVIIDDTYPLITYHRRAGDSSISPDEDNSFGDGTELVESQPMSLVIYGNSSRLRVSPEQIETFCILAMPTEVDQSLLSGIQIDKIRTLISGTKMDSISVFNEEYQGTQYPLGQDDFLIKIQYTITSHFRKSCIDICDC